MMQQRLVRDLYKILKQINTEDLPSNIQLPESFSQLVSNMKNNQYDAKTFALVLKGTVCIILSTMHLIFSFPFPTVGGGLHARCFGRFFWPSSFS